MKKLFSVLVILIVALSLVGCTAGITLTITPNPIDVSSGSDIVNATVTITTTGMGALTISRVTAALYDAAVPENILYSFDSNTDSTDFPVQVPFVVEGYSKNFELQEFLGQKTVDEIIFEHGSAIGISTYADLVGKTYILKVEITTDTLTSYEATVNFN